jgi:hypothetical protein
MVTKRFNGLKVPVTVPLDQDAEPDNEICLRCYIKRYSEFINTVNDCQKRMDEVQSKLWMIESDIKELRCRSDAECYKA